MNDVVVIGSGPAGLFAALELSKLGMEVLLVEQGMDVRERICPMKRLGRCTHCDPCKVMCGVGGSGTFSDGLLNLNPTIGGDLVQLVGESEAWRLVEGVDSTFVSYGANSEIQKPSPEDVEALGRRAASAGATFVDIRQRHMGSDKTPEIISAFKRDLEARGVRFRLNARVTDIVIEGSRCSGIRLYDGTIIKASKTVLAPGRVGAQWIGELIDRLGIRARFGPLDVGVRVEVPAIIMDPVTRINHDPKFYIITHRYDDFIRTFCTNPGGFVVKEEYRDFIATNGHSLTSHHSLNTNFAFLVRLELTHPLENTTEYGISIAKLATTIGGRKPLIQRLGDLHRGRRTTEERLFRNPVRNTLEDVTPGDISMALPHRVVMDVIEGLDVLSKIIPGVSSDSTLLYAPEIKFYARRVLVDRDLETNIEDLFVAGDGAGLSRGIVAAAATGILAARGIASS